jgi:hypothetical protein
VRLVAAHAKAFVCVSQRSCSLAAPAEHHAPAGKSAKVQHEEDKKVRRCSLPASRPGRPGRRRKRAGLAPSAAAPSRDAPAPPVQAFMEVYKTLTAEIIADEVADNQARPAAASRTRRSRCSRSLCRPADR